MTINTQIASDVATGSILVTLSGAVGVEALLVASGGVCETLFGADFVRAEDGGVQVFDASDCALWLC